MSFIFQKCSDGNKCVPTSLCNTANNVPGSNWIKPQSVIKCENDSEICCDISNITPIEPSKCGMRAIQLKVMGGIESKVGKKYLKFKCFEI